MNTLYMLFVYEVCQQTRYGINNNKNLMFDINMYDLFDLPNKVTYCNWRTGIVFNGTENYIFSWNHNIIKFISTRWATIEMSSNGPPKFSIVVGEC